jgi:hypothetical protein
MSWRAVRYLVGSLVLVALAGCGRSWLAEREPWRRDAEVACLKSGAVREGPAVAQIRAIDGPGICGADFPLRVSALGHSSALGFADAPRPPGMIPQYSPAPQRQRFPDAAPYGRAAPERPGYGGAPPAPSNDLMPPPGAPMAAPGAPLQIHPSGLDPADGDGSFDPDAEDENAPPSYPTQRIDPRLRSSDGARPPFPPAEPGGPPLGPSRAMAPAGPAGVQPTATLACPMVSALDQWIDSAVQPAAQRWFGQPVVEIKQISSYSCRSMNGQRGMPISEHAFGNAIDIAAFTLADGRKVSVRDGWRGRSDESGFLHDVHAAACQAFTTVLAPGSNAFHYDHIHLDLRRHASGRSICNPRPIPGDLVAGRRGGDTTGAIARGLDRPRLGFALEEHPAATFDAALPRAEPGAD